MNFRKAVLILVIFLALAGIPLYIYAQNISLKYQITDLKIKLAELNSHNRQLGGQVTQAEKLSYIEKTAKEKLGMIYPEKIIYVIPGSKTPPAPAAGTDSSRGNRSSGVRP